MSHPEHAAQVATQCGAGLAVCSGMARWLIENHTLISSIGVMVGILVGVCGLLANVYFKWRAERLGLCELELMRERGRGNHR